MMTSVHWRRMAGRRIFCLSIRPSFAYSSPYTFLPPPPHLCPLSLYFCKYSDKTNNMINRVMSLPEWQPVLTYTCWLSLTSLGDSTFLTAPSAFSPGPCSIRAVVLPLSLVTMGPPVQWSLINSLIWSPEEQGQGSIEQLEIACDPVTWQPRLRLTAHWLAVPIPPGWGQDPLPRLEH